MKRFSILLSIVGLSVLPAGVFATETASAKSQASTVMGCLRGPNAEGVYTLKSGAKDVEVGGPADLKDHVGQKVKLSGTWTNRGRDIGEKSGNEKAAARSNAESHERRFEAKSVQRIADTCVGNFSSSISSTYPSR